MRKLKIRNRVGLHPVMTFLILCFVVIILSGFLHLFNVQATFNEVNSISGSYQVTTESINSLLNLSGIKYIFTNTVSNFANFTVLPHLIIILLGFGIMERSGFLKTLITILTKKAKKTTVTFFLVFCCMISSIMGDLSYIIFIPLSALLFLYGKRNPMIGIIASFAALTCGSGLSILLTSVDSSLLTTTLTYARLVQPNIVITPGSFFFIMLVAVLTLSVIITNITENIIAKNVPKYEFNENKDIDDDLVFTKNKKRGLLIAFIGGLIYLLIFIYNIIPGLPFSGNLLDYSQNLYIDKLFSYNSFFSNGFVFIVTIFFVILGLGYGIGAKTIKNNKEFVDALGSSLNGIGKILLMIFASATFISIVKQTNLGNVVGGFLVNIVNNSQFTGLPLILLFFIASMITTLFLPTPINKWLILASCLPTLIEAGISPEFGQVIFRFGESVTLGLTPLFSYFIVYLAYLEKYSQNDKQFKLSKAIKYQVPYSFISLIVFVIMILLWYILNIPLGLGSAVGI